MSSPMPAFRRSVRILQRLQHLAMWAEAASEGHIVTCGCDYKQVLDTLSATCPMRTIQGFATDSWGPAEQDNVILQHGAFEETIPYWLSNNGGSVALLHISTDDYESVRTALIYLDRRLVRGTIIIFDSVMASQGAFKALQMWEQTFGRRLEPLSLGPNNVAALRVLE